MDHHSQKTAEHYNQDNKKEAKKVQKNTRPSVLSTGQDLPAATTAIYTFLANQVFFSSSTLQPVDHDPKNKTETKKIRWFWLGESPLSG